jgi:hypothetical protein
MKKFNKKGLLPVLLTVLVGGVIVYAATAPSLQTASNFAILAGSGITDTTPSVIVGDVGSSPTTSNGVTGAEVTGTNYTAGSAVVDQAKLDLTAAYTNAAGQVSTTAISADLGGQTLTSGVYQDNGAPASLSLTGTLTLNAQGDPNAVFIFKSASTLTTAASSQISLINGAQACNVFWQVGSSATLGTNSVFKGNILALTSITDNGGSTIAGRLLARNGAVTLNNTRVTKASCVAPVAPLSPAISVTPAVVATSSTSVAIIVNPATSTQNAATSVVVVAPLAPVLPKLPNTGLAPTSENNIFGVVLAATITMSLALIYLARRKQII